MSETVNNRTEYDLKTASPTKQRKSEYSRPDEWIIKFLQEADVGHIATRWDDQPFITPSTFWYDHERHELCFHSNIAGRIRANIERHPQVCFEISRVGQALPSNVALEFSIQYASVIAFGKIRVIEDEAEKEKALYGLIRKYFPEMSAGKEYRPITEKELVRTSVYAISIDSWSGKENWKDRAEQSDDWDPLPEDVISPAI